jgi:hypothetical protein
MSNHLNMYSQKGCVNCKVCEGGGANIGRSATLWTIGICTAGIGLIFLPFFKKCQYCHHNTWWNKHYGPDMRATAHAPASAVQGTH